MKSLLLSFSLCAQAMALQAESVEFTAIDRLLEGNRRYVKDQLEHPNRTSDRREAVVASQEPFAIIVGCADSRVAPEIVFDQGVGDLFVVRVAGNVVGPLELDSIDYALLYLHAKEILVLGHENCGAVKAVMQGITKDIEAVAALIEPAIVDVKKEMTNPTSEAAIKANAVHIRDYLMATPVAAKLLSEKKIAIHAGYYDLKTGEVVILEK